MAKHLKSGFTLITVSIILTVASLIFVATLPGVQTSLKSGAASVTKMNSILNTMRGYMAANGYLPCPADPTLALGASNYGAAAANPGTTNNCTGSTPAAAYADSTNHIAIGMVPVKTLGLSYADAVDGFGRDITYAVDTNATSCWASSSLAGAITVNDNGISYNTVAVLVSHGADGYGAWLPLSGTSGTASRFDNGSTDTAQADTAQVAHGGGLTANTTFVSFVNKAATATFDDNVVYKSNLYTLNTLPAAAWAAYPAVTPPANGTYPTGNVLTFTLTFGSAVTVNTANGTPRLDLSALGSGSIGTSNKAYATYQSGSGTNTLTFSYTIQVTDSAPVSGLAMTGGIDLNGGNISGSFTCFTAPNLSGVLIDGGPYYRTVTIDYTKVGTVNHTDQTNFPVLFAGTYSYLATVANGGNVTNANGYDITFTSDAAGHNLLPFERESWNASTGASVFWIKVPTVSHTTDTVIYLQYANSTITTDQSNKTGTWDSNFKGVWHLDESGNGTSGEFKDSTSNANNGTGGNGTSSQTPTQTTGLIGYGQSFASASSQWIVKNSASNLPNINGNQTISFWYKVTSYSSDPLFMVSTQTNGFLSGANEIPVSSSNLIVQTASSNPLAYTSSSPTANAWHMVTHTWDGTTHRLYIDGSQQVTGTTSPDTGACGTITWGTVENNSAGGGWYFNGLLDETQISNTARSADWIKTEYNSQSAPDKATYGASGFYTVGAQTSR
jgi:type II secretory pathway pseudopilin PulG